MMRENIIREDFFHSYNISFFIRYFDTDKTKSRDWSLDTDRFCLEREGKIFFETFDFCKSNSFARAEAILDNGRTDTLPFHLDINTELEKSFFDKKRFFLYFFGRYDCSMLDFIQEFHTRKIPRSKINMVLWLLFNNFSITCFQRDFFGK